MRFGFIFFGRDLGAVGDTARLGEDHGFEHVGLCDSPSLAFDPYMALTLAAANTTAVELGPTVTNPQNRHPLVLANLAAGLEQLAPGRSFLGIGTGNSAVRHAGAGPATLDALERAVQTIKSLLQGDAVEFGSSRTRVMGGGKRVPILMAGSGPKALRLAGKLADKVYVNVGVLPEVIEDGFRWVQEGAESAGRDPDTVERWVFVPGAIADDGRRALDEAKTAALALAAYALRGDPSSKRMPPAVQEKVGTLLREYVYDAHLTPGRTPNYFLADRLGIAEYLLERFSIAGTAADCVRKIETLRAVGVENICFSFSAGPDVTTYIRGFGEQVLPELLETDRARPTV